MILMRMAMLLTPDVPPLPEGMCFVEQWGDISIMDERTMRVVFGKHVLVEGSERAFRKWLSPLNGFWKDVGESPAFQKFEIAHVVAPL